MNTDTTPVFSDQLILFRHITVDKVTDIINDDIFEAVLGNHYEDFIKLCNEVIDDPTVVRVSCTLENDEMVFDIEHNEE